MNLIHQLTPLYTWKLFLFPKIITLCLDLWSLYKASCCVFYSNYSSLNALRITLLFAVIRFFYVLNYSDKIFWTPADIQLFCCWDLNIHAGLSWPHFFSYCHFLSRSSAWNVCMCTLRAMPFVLNWIVLLDGNTFFLGGGGEGRVKGSYNVPKKVCTEDWYHL